MPAHQIGPSGWRQLSQTKGDAPLAAMGVCTCQPDVLGCSGVCFWKSECALWAACWTQMPLRS